MIRNPSSINPLKNIIEALPDKWAILRKGLVDDINKLLFQAGVVCENENETLKCIDLLKQLKVLEIDSNDSLVYIKRGINGEISK